MTRELDVIEEVPGSQEEVQEEIQEGSIQDSSYADDESLVDDEYPENVFHMLANTLITTNGEVLADVMAGIRDSLDKLNKILYNKLGKPQ